MIAPYLYKHIVRSSLNWCETFNSQIKQHATNQSDWAQVVNKFHLIKLDYRVTPKKQHATIYNIINNKKMG